MRRPCRRSRPSRICLRRSPCGSARSRRGAGQAARWSRASRSSATSSQMSAATASRSTTLVGPDGDAHVYSPTPADATPPRRRQARRSSTASASKAGWPRWSRPPAPRPPVVEAAKGVQPLQGRGARRTATATATSIRMPGRRRQREDLRRQYPRCARRGRPGRQGRLRGERRRLSRQARRARRGGAGRPSTASRRTAARSSPRTTPSAISQQAYGLDFIAPQGVSTEAEASAKDVARIIRQIQAREDPGGVPREHLRSAPDRAHRRGDRRAGSAARSIPTPCRRRTARPATYIDMMRHNIRALSAALSS